MKYTPISIRIFTFANQVAEGVARVHPDKKLIIYAYSLFQTPPSGFKCHPNLIVQYCFWPLRVAGNWDPKLEKMWCRGAAAWKQSAYRLAVFEYFIAADPDLPLLMPELIGRSLKRLHELGYSHYATLDGDDYAINGLNYYLLSKLLWDPSLDESAIQRDYVEKGFGKAAPAIERYFERLTNQWKALRGDRIFLWELSLPECELLTGTYLSPEIRAACHRDLDEALKLAEGEDRERVQFVRNGFRYVDLTVDAVERTIPLLRAGWNLSRQVSAPPSPNMEDFQRALSAWEERDRYVESLKNDFVLAYLWIRYNDRFRNFNPLARMRQYR